MRQRALLPIEFEGIADQVHWAHEVVHGFEWAGSCPQCGGVVHQNGEWPDRLRLWPKSRKTGKPLAWCRHCGWKWTPAKESKPDPALVAKLEAERLRAIAEHAKAVQRARNVVRTEKKWEDYHKYLMWHSGAKKVWAESLGMPVEKAEEWFTYWRLGASLGHVFWRQNGNEQYVSFKSNTLTFPICDLDGKVINIKHRLMQPGEDGIRYRQEYRGTGEGVFIANRKLLNKGDWAILAEGDKKAMVTFITASNVNIQVYGLPMTPSLDLLGGITAKHILYIPDPDAFEDGKKYAINRVVSVFAQRDLRIIKLPEKIDDYIIKEHKDRKWIVEMFKLPRWSGKILWSEYQ
jgi:hypothetical protein